MKSGIKTQPHKHTQHTYHITHKKVKKKKTKIRRTNFIRIGREREKTKDSIRFTMKTFPYMLSAQSGICIAWEFEW